MFAFLLGRGLRGKSHDDFLNFIFRGDLNDAFFDVAN
jgi:hypothetical protein